MIRILLLVILICSPVFGQGMSFGLHGCGAWSKAEIQIGSISIESDDSELFYGLGADVSFKPPLSPIGVEGGFTYLMHSEEEGDIEFKMTSHPIYVNGKYYLSPMMYVGGGVNYTLWGMEFNDEEVEDLKSALGFQFGGGIELSGGGRGLYANAFYMIQKGKHEPESGMETDIELKSLQIRVGIRFGG